MLTSNTPRVPKGTRQEKLTSTSFHLPLGEDKEQGKEEEVRDAGGWGATMVAVFVAE